MVAFGVSPNTLIIDLKTGRLTREGFQLIQGLNQALLGANSDVVQTDTTQTLTGKTIDGDQNTLQDIATASLKTTTGEDTAVVTGTAGVAGTFGSWNADGDMVGSGKAVPTGDVVGTTDTQILTNKTIDGYLSVLIGTATYDPPNLVDGAGATTTVTVTGAALGDIAVASFSLSTQGIGVTATVTAADTVTVRFQNETVSTIDLSSGTLKAVVFH